MAKRQQKADRLAKKGVKYPATKVVQATAASDKTRKQKAVKDDKWSDEYTKQYILRCKKEARDASLERRTAWKELWLLYQNKQDYKKKKSWQSKCFVPKIWMKVERAAATVKRGLLQISKLFKLEMDDVDVEDERKLEQLEVDGKTIEKKFKRRIAGTNFTNVYSEAVKAAFLLGLGVIKVLWAGKDATYENVDILNLNIDPAYQPFQDNPPKYMIEYKEMDLAELRRTAEETNEAAGEEIFKMGAIKKIEEDFRKKEAQSERQQRMGMSQYTPTSKRIGIDEFWGDVVSKDGLDIQKNQALMLANEKYIIRQQDNPFKHQRPVYIFIIPILYPHRGMAGISLVEPSAKLQYTYNNIINLYMDNLNFTVNKMLECAPLALQDPKEIMTIFPGKVFMKQSTEQAVREIQMTNVGPDAIPALETVGREIQEGTAVTEFLMGMPSRKTKTKGEVEIKTAESQGLFDVIARDLEQNSIKPLLEMTYSLYVQYAGYPDIEGIFNFKVGGLSLLIMQKEQIQAVGQTLTAALSQPELRQRTDIDDLWRKYLSILNLSDVYIEPEQQQKQPLAAEHRRFIEGQAGKDSKDMVARAQQEAKRDVANMGPQQIMRMAG